MSESIAEEQKEDILAEKEFPIEIENLKFIFNLQ